MTPNDTASDRDDQSTTTLDPDRSSRRGVPGSDAVLGIHSVEARHASFLNELNVSSPFPVGVDAATSMAEVKEIAGQFIVN